MKSEELYDNVMKLIETLCKEQPRQGFEIEYLTKCADVLELYREVLDKLNTRKIDNLEKKYDYYYKTYVAYKKQGSKKPKEGNTSKKG